MMKGLMTFKTILGACMSLTALSACESQMRDFNSSRATVTTEGIAAESKSLETNEQQASFPGGQEALLDFLDKNVRYPNSYDGCGQGRVVVSFIINADGSITHPKVERSVDKELDDEALRVVGLMPKWIPAKEKGKNKKSKFFLPILIKSQ